MVMFFDEPSLLRTFIACIGKLGSGFAASILQAPKQKRLQND